VIEVYKVLSWKYDPSVSIQIPTAEVSFTRGNKYKIFKDSFTLDIRKYLGLESIRQYCDID